MPVYEFRCSTCHAVFATTGPAAAPTPAGMCGGPVAWGCGSGCACS